MELTETKAVTIATRHPLTLFLFLSFIYMSKPFHLTKKARAYIYKAYHLFPHEVIGAEIKSMQLRLEYLLKLREEQKQLLEATDDGQTFYKTFKTDPVATEQEIIRLEDEIMRATKEFQFQQKKVLSPQNTK